MSLSPPTPSQSFPPPTLPPPDSTPTDQPRFGREKTSNLYLIAFLAILFILLFISACIVLRSYIVRRRYQQRLQDALGPGVLLTPRAQGSKIKRLGILPKITHTWLAQGGDKWNQMMPISVQPVFVKRKIRVTKQSTPDQTTDITDVPAPPTTISNLFTRFPRPSLPNIFQSNVTNEQQAPTPSTPNYKIRVEMLQLAIFIAMPSQDKSHRKKHSLENNDPDPDDDKLPEVAIGVTRVNYRQPKSAPSPTLPPL